MEAIASSLDSRLPSPKLVNEIPNVAMIGYTIIASRKSVPGSRYFSGTRRRVA